MTVNVTVGTDQVSLPWPTGWDPSQLGFTARPTGAGYVPIESLGVTLDGAGLRAAAIHPAANGQVLTLPGGVFAFNDYMQGSGTFMHGLMVNSDLAGPHIRGIVGSGAATVIQMVPDSSHWKSNAAAEQGGTSTGAQQVTCSIIQFYKIANVEIGNLTVQGQPQPHYHHGVRINGDGAHVHHVNFLGASQGDSTSPPGETYSLMVSGANAVIEDSNFDGRRLLAGDTTTRASSTLICTTGSRATIVSRCHGHHNVAGFPLVMWLSDGLVTNDLWGESLGTGVSGRNGALINHEMSSGTIRHNRPHAVLDAWWTNKARSQGKFPHMTFMQATPGSTPQPNGYADTQIIDPTFDTWGGKPGGFAIGTDEKVSALPAVIRTGVKQNAVTRPQWWVDSPAIDTSRQFWVVSVSTTQGGSASVWG